MASDKKWHMHEKNDVCNENENIFNLARSKIAVLGLQKHHSKAYFVLV